MNFRDLEYVLEVSRTLNFTEASKLCNVSQPSLSYQIKKLETELGANIFTRRNKKVFLTSFGEFFIEKAANIIALQNQIKNESGFNNDLMSGKIRIGGIYTVAPYLFPKIVDKITKQSFNLEYSLFEQKTDELIKSLLEDRIDVAIISLPIDENSLEAYSYFDEPFYLAVPKNHSLAKKKNIKNADLKSEDLILLEDGHCFRTQSIDICHATMAKENQTFRGTSLETIKSFVSIGQGMTIVPKIAINSNDGIKYIPFEDKKFSREIGFVWKKSSKNKMQIKKIVEFITKEIYF